MRQIAALKLGMWSKWITYAPSVQTKYFTAPQPQPQDGWIVPGTGASTGSDLNGGAITVACGLLNAWIAQQLAHTHVWDAFQKQGQRWFVPAEYSAEGALLRAQSDLWPQAAAILTSMNLLPNQTAHAFYFLLVMTQTNTEIGKAHVGSPFYVSHLLTQLCTQRGSQWRAHGSHHAVFFIAILLSVYVCVRSSVFVVSTSTTPPLPFCARSTA